MRTLIIISGYLMAVLTLSGCSDPASGNGNDTQIFLVWAGVNDYYYNDSTGEEIENTLSTEIQGVVLANPLPSFDYFKIGDTQFNTSSNYDQGYLSFQNDILGVENPLLFEGKTSLGKVSGSISLPDTIKAISVNNQEIQIGQSIMLSWNGSNANFYRVSGEYEWRDVNSNWHYISLDTLITENSVTYDGSIFSYDGVVYIYVVIPINGPFPQEGATANLSGAGTGFLYYENKYFYAYMDIQVGTGLSKSSISNSLLKHNLRKKQNTKFKVFEKLGFTLKTDQAN